MKQQLAVILAIGLLLLSSITFIPVSSEEPMIIAMGTTYYVDDDNTEGPWDGTIAHQYRYIEGAIDAAVDGDTVYVYSGTYYNGISIFIDKRINLIGEDRDEVIIDGGGNFPTGIVVKNVENVYISNFTLINCTTSTTKLYQDMIWGAFFVTNSNYTTISNCCISNSRTSLFVADSSDIMISNCEFSDAEMGLYILNYSSWWWSNPQLIKNTRISNCIFNDVGISELYLDNATITNCTIVGNLSRDDASGIWIDDCDVNNCIIWDNIIWDDDGDVNQVYPAGGWDVFDCCIEGGWPSTNPYHNPPIIDVNPLFADSGYWDDNGTPEDRSDDIWIQGDYHLKSVVG